MRKIISMIWIGILTMSVIVGFTFSAGASTMAGFSDVPSSHVNYNAIMDLRTRGIIAGYPDGTFKPDQMVNRVEALKIIINSAKVSVGAAPAQAVFKDTAADQWYAPFLAKAVELKIVAGYPDGSFKPTQTVNLVENLKILLNTHAVDVAGLAVEMNAFADVSQSDWFASFVQYAKNKKLIVAEADNKIMPAQGMTRAKLAEVVFRLIYMKEHGLDYFGQVKEDTPPITAPDQGRDDTLQVSIKDMSFKLPEMTVPQGAVVKWTNNDGVSHNVVSSGNFQSPILANGQSWQYTFKDLGTFEYTCTLHPGMTGKIIVKPENQVPTI